MTTAEMKEEFLQLYDKVAGSSAPGYTNDEISNFLNKAVIRLVKKRFYWKGNKYREGFETTEKRRKDLSELVKAADLGSSTYKSSDQTAVSKNGEYWDLPEDLMYTIREEATIDATDCDGNNKRIGVRPVTHDEYTSNINNPFRKPSEDKIWRLDVSREDLTEDISSNNRKRHELVTDGSYSINTYHIRYVKIPTEIDIDNDINTELDSSVHDEIIDEAVKIATGVTNIEEYKVKQVETTQSE